METTEETTGKQDYGEDKIIDMTMFACMPGTSISDGNEIQELIAEKTGVRVTETWLTNQSTTEAVSALIASGELPDFIDAGDGNVVLYEDDLLVAWDPYLEQYPNLKEMYSDAEWGMMVRFIGLILMARARLQII